MPLDVDSVERAGVHELRLTIAASADDVLGTGIILGSQTSVLPVRSARVSSIQTL